MKVVHVAAEMAPLAKVGGLGDMVGGLGKELNKIGNEVEIILPRYSFLKCQESSCTSFQSYEKGKWHEAIALNMNYKGVKVSLLDSKEGNSYFNRPNIYGYPDDACRFIYFSRAALDYLLTKKENIDILHLHDWHTSLCAVLYKDLFQELGVKIKKIVLNIHNLEYQGICGTEDLDRVGVEGENYLSSERLRDTSVLFSQNLNLLKGGIIYSDAIVLVSPTYSREVLTKEYGYGLEKVLKEQEHKLVGILNGIDTEFWNPENDSFIHNHYDQNMAIEKVIYSKNRNKELLRKRLKLKESSNPLISCISRLVPQKGPELIEDCLNFTMQHGGQFVLLGFTTIERIQNRFKEIARKHEHDENLSLNLVHEESLAHQIYASSDFLIVPSLFEPCGLTQMISLRYGTIPIVRKTGGLADTVFDMDEHGISVGNGFAFNEFSKKSFEETLNRVFNYWKNGCQTIQKAIENGIKIDYSLKKTAEEYMQLYLDLINF